MSSAANNLRQTFRRFHLPSKWESVLLTIAIAAIIALQAGIAAYSPIREPGTPFELLSLLLPYVLVLLAIVFGIYSFIQGAVQSSLLPPLRFFVIIGIFLFFLFMLPPASLEEREPNPEAGLPSNSTTMTTVGPTSSTKTDTTSSGFFPPLLITFDISNPRFLLLLVLSSILIGAAFLLISRGIIRHTKAVAEDEEDNGVVPEPWIADSREKVIHHYLRASDALELAGADPDRSLTPREFSRHVSNRFQETIADPARNLTGLYEEARFSKHSVSDLQALEADRETSEVLRRLSESEDDEDEPV